MLDARQYLVRETLRNGLEVQIRSLRPDDCERIAEAFSKLTPESIYARFFFIKKGMTDQDHRLIRELDFETRVVLVVAVVEGGREVVIGSGSYSRMGTNAAEVAFLVEEDYHGLGIAKCVLRHLAIIAIEHGIVRFEASVLPNNKPMLNVFASSGWPLTSRYDDGVIHIVIDLTARRRAKGTSARKRASTRKP